MVPKRKNRFADLPAGADNPLNAAVVARDGSTLEMVQQAVAHNETLMAYQPVMSAGDQGRVAFYEGLIRVLDATGRVIPAKDFMHLAEDTELGRQIDTQALRMAIGVLQSYPWLRLSVNMSARSIGYKPWMRLLDQTLRRSPTIAERLILEISEQSAMHVPELVAQFIAEYNPKGISFAMDRFGAGHMAIRYFKDFFFDILKIDGQFIRGISNNPDNQVVTAALLAVAREFDMLTVAENVETQADAQLVTQLGADCLQGYFFSAPTVRPSWRKDKFSPSHAG